ncbi:MAG: YHYH protein [Verrucomicrobiota bacterium]
MKKPLFLTLSLFSALAASAHSGSEHDQLVSANQYASIAPEVSITVEGNYRIIRSNGIPEHAVGKFPNRGNPHSIKAQVYNLRMPLNPTIAQSATPLVRQPFGVALNGVLFDPGTAEYYQGNRHSEWTYEALTGPRTLGLDTNHGHVQPNGAYHYHGLPTLLFEELRHDSQQMTLIGWAADGFPIYGIYGYKDPDDSRSGLIALKSSYRIKAGNRPSGSGSPGGEYDGSFSIDYEYIAGLGDLDECGGRFGVTPEFPNGTYYYVLTEDYPFVPRMFRGTPDSSFEKRRRGPRPRF